MTAPDHDLDEKVRAADPDRWLATRFAPADARADLVTLYALNDELARVGEHVTNPLMGEIRLAWWREGLESMAGGGAPRAHPVMTALQPAVAAGRLPMSLLDTLVEARHADLETAPFADEAALVAYIDGTAGAVMAAAAHALDPAATPQAVVGAARAWGWAGLYRAGAAWTARGRRWTPLAWADASEAEIASHIAHRVEAALKTASEELKTLPVGAFPAVAYATLARPYLKHQRLTDLGRQARLVVAVTRGRI
jgi:phytoene synthase